MKKPPDAAARASRPFNRTVQVLSRGRLLLLERERRMGERADSVTAAIVAGRITARVVATACPSCSSELGRKKIPCTKNSSWFALLLPSYQNTTLSPCV